VKESDADIKIDRAIFLFTVREHLMINIPITQSLLLYLSNKGKILTATLHSSTSAELSAVWRLFEAVDIAQTHGSNLLSDPAQE
jgi:hypothetical protein